LQILHVFCEFDDFGGAKPNEVVEIFFAAVVDMIKFLLTDFNGNEDVEDKVEGSKPSSIEYISKTFF
jgi:hypothetical protein